MSYLVRFAPEAAGHLESLYSYISGSATPTIAAGFVDAIMNRCEGLAAFPHRGTARDGLRPGLRTMSPQKRVVIAFTVDDSHQQVTILGVFYGGQDFESAFNDPVE
ncbi:MAG: type II toxin-antitoxin system RelE/ParE family toxin [Dermatophilaceae bacterium]